MRWPPNSASRPMLLCAACDGDPVPAGLLGVVERRVGGGEQVGQLAGLAPFHGRDADRDRQADGRARSGGR